MRQIGIVAAGAALVVTITALWHGPLGGGERFATSVEAEARAQLARDEMSQVQARLERGPLTRQIILSGPADDFQRGEIARRMVALPGIGAAAWDANSLPAEARR